MKAQTAFRLYASSPQGTKIVSTNNEQLAEQELIRQGYPKEFIARPVYQMAESLDEIMYFDDNGQIIPLSVLRKPNSYK